MIMTHYINLGFKTCNFRGKKKKRLLPPLLSRFLIFLFSFFLGGEWGDVQMLDGNGMAAKWNQDTINQLPLKNLTCQKIQCKIMSLGKFHGDNFGYDLHYMGLAFEF